MTDKLVFWIKFFINLDLLKMVLCYHRSIKYSSTISNGSCGDFTDF